MRLTLEEMGRGTGNQLQLDLGLGARRDTVANAGSVEDTSGAGVGADWTKEEVETLFAERPEAAALSLAYLSDPAAYGRGYIDTAPRRALEAVLAAHQGVDPDSWRHSHAHESWLDLYRQAREIRFDGDGLLTRTAVRIEDAHRRADARGVRLGRQSGPQPLAADLAALAASVGPGQRSGDLDQYSRAELCKLLGYLQRDAKVFSDDDLRAMALEQHLVPRYKGAPSHVELAARRAESYSSERIRKNEFRKGLRKPYGKVSQFGAYADDGRRDVYSVLDDLRQIHPFVADALYERANRAEIEAFAHANGVATMLSAEDKNESSSAQRYVSSIEARFGDAIHAYLQALGGGKLRRVQGHSLTGSWRSSVRDHYKSLAVYMPSSGEIHLNPAIDRLVTRAQIGKATPEEVYEAAKVIAHETLHAASGGDGGCGVRGIQQHTIEEGGAEANARLQVDGFARSLGIWSGSQSLRDPANRGDMISYPREVEAMNVIWEVCAGSFDLDKLRSGAYAEPEGLSTSAQSYSLNTHTKVPLLLRKQKLIEDARARWGVKAETIVNALLNAPKRRDLSTQIIRYRNASGGYSQIVERPQQSFSDALASLIEDALND